MQIDNESSPFHHKYSINCNGILVDFSTPKVMGILNITPDSFFSTSRAQSEKEVLHKIEKMIVEGVDFVDIGAFSSRPNADLISYEEERQRLIPVLSIVQKYFAHLIISIDTYRSDIAKEAIDHGASIINDISGGRLDSKMFTTVAALNVPLILMHMKGVPNNMQNSPSYDNVFNEIYHFFSLQLAKLNEAGVNDVIIDPGFGFGKTLEHNYQLLKKLNFFHSLERPIMVGLSRKKMIQQLVNEDVSNALNGTTAAHVIALLNGANILRVHDVKAAQEAIQIVDFYQKQ